MNDRDDDTYYRVLISPEMEMRILCGVDGMREGEMDGHKVMIHPDFICPLPIYECAIKQGDPKVCIKMIMDHNMKNQTNRALAWNKGEQK